MDGRFGRNYERRNADGSWSCTEDFSDLKVGDVLRNNSGPLTVSSLRNDGGQISFIANRIDGSDEGPVALLHLDGMKGAFPAQMFPLPEGNAEFKAQAVDGASPETATPAVELPDWTDFAFEKTAPKHGGSDEPEGSKNPKVTTKALILEALADGTEKDAAAVNASIAAAGKVVKPATVTWTLGAMVNGGEIVKTETGTYRTKQ